MSFLNIISYLEIVLDMEKEIFFQNKAIEKIKEQIESLGHARKFEKPKSPDENADFKCISSILAAVGLIVVTFLLWCFRNETKYDDYFMTKFLSGVILIIAIILSIVSVISVFNAIINVLFLFDKTEINNYNKAYDEYLKATENDKIRVNNELILKSQLESDVEQLIQQNLSTKRTLEEIYNKGIIYPKYRNFIAISYIYEIIASGQKKHLGEAYDSFEYLSRMDKIIFDLECILTSLEQIKNNQYMLYASIKEINGRLDYLITLKSDMLEMINNLSDNVKDTAHKLEELKKNSYIATYNSERIKKEIEYLNKMKYLSGDFDEKSDD